MAQTVNRSSARIVTGVTFGIVFQAFLLARTPGWDAKWAACFVVLVGGAAACLTARTRHSNARPLLEMLLVTGSIGGLAMLLGSMLDVHFATAGTETRPSCHAAVGSSAVLGMPGLGFDLVPALNWMNGLMLVACVGGCVFLCSPRGNCQFGNYFDRCKTHVLLAVGMLLGMPFGAHFGSSLLGRAFGEVAGMHLAMVGGMLLGVTMVWPLTALTFTRSKSLALAQRQSVSR